MSDNDDATTVNAQLQDVTSAGKAQYASPDVGTQTICTSYLQPPEDREPEEFVAFVLGADEGATTLQRTGFSGSDDDGNYAIYESENGAITGMYIHRNTFDGEAPEEISLSMAEASEGDFEEAENAQEDEAEALFA